MSANYIDKYAETIEWATEPTIHSLHLQCWNKEAEEGIAIGFPFQTLKS